MVCDGIRHTRKRTNFGKNTRFMDANGRWTIVILFIITNKGKQGTCKSENIERYNQLNQLRRKTIASG